MGKIVYGFKNGILLLPKKNGVKTDSGDQQPIHPNSEDIMIFYAKLKKRKKMSL